MDFKPSDLPSMDQKLHFFSNPIKKSVSQLMLFFSLIISSIVFYNIIRPLQPRSLIDIGYLSQILSKTSKTCDYSYGKWVRDETQSLRRYTEKCPLLDPGFRCRQNGRKDLDYQKWRWQPEGCHLPRYD